MQKKKISKHEAKKKAEDFDKFRENANKRKREHEAKKKAEDIDKFREKANKRKHEQEARQKAEDIDKFKENANKRKSKQEAKQRAEDLENFKANMRERKLNSNSNVSATQRLERFRKKVQYGPIFVCSCCHQKFFDNQVEEFTEKLKEQIDTANP